MAVKKSEVKASSNFSYEDAVKAIKSIKGSASVIGKEEITELCSVKNIITGIPSLDFMGSFTKGRINLLAGNPSSAKSTLIQQIIPRLIDEIKESGDIRFGLYIDAEGSFDEKYAQVLGIDLKYMIIKQNVKVLEEALQEATALMESNLLSFVVIDSIDALIPRKQENCEFENVMGAQAGALAAHLPSFYAKVVSSNTSVFLVKQARIKMGVTSQHGEIITFSGGKALRHICHNIFIMKRKSNKDLDYVPVSVKAEKTRNIHMGITLELPLSANGFDKVRDLTTIGIMVGLFVKSGAWFSYTDKDGNTKQVQGVDKLVSTLREDKELFDSLMTQFYEKYINNSEIKVVGAEELIVDVGE